MKSGKCKNCSQTEREEEKAGQGEVVQEKHNFIMNKILWHH